MILIKHRPSGRPPFIGAWLLICLVALFPPPSLAAISGVEHVVIIGCDGMGSVAFGKPAMPVIKRLMDRGAYTLEARGVMPTSSSPNWASMIMGAGPEQHGVTSNDWQTNHFDIAPAAAGPAGTFPTIFGILRDQRPAAVIVALYDWSDFGRLIEPYATDLTVHVKDAIETAKKAADVIREKKPTFLFVHFDGVDHAGHAFGWGSQPYVKAVELADSLIGGILDALSEAGIADKTLVMVTADHGGVGTKHGGATLDESLIPWIIAGPGVVQGHQIQAPVNTYDTAATIAHAFGLKTPEAWIGRPVLECFE